VSDGETLIPILGYTTADERLVGNDAAVAVNPGRSKLESNEVDADDAALTQVR
jgi:hypothetical protein